MLEATTGAGAPKWLRETKTLDVLITDIRLADATTGGMSRRLPENCIQSFRWSMRPETEQRRPSSPRKQGANFDTMT